MAETKIARRYAKSLLGLARERNMSDKVYADMELIAATCAASRELVTLLRNPIVQGDKKEAVIKALFGSKIDAVTNGFLTIVIRKGRESYLDGIASEYVKIHKEEQGIVSAVVTTSTKMDDNMRNSILAIVKGMKGDKVELTEKVDADLIGGFVLRVGDQQHDASVSRKLRQLKNEFDDNLYIREY
jgi:F-type H+-transporting ATPase subunit delta